MVFSFFTRQKENSKSGTKPRGSSGGEDPAERSEF